MLILKQSGDIHWTLHAKAKMRFYGISEQRVKRILHTPKRVEEGIAPDTIAVMQSAGSSKHPHELWVMLSKSGKSQNSNYKIGTMRIISAWRYPGQTKPGSEISLKMLTNQYLEYAEDK